MLICLELMIFFFFFFNDTATTEIYTLSLHDALPIYRSNGDRGYHDHEPRGDVSWAEGTSTEHAHGSRVATDSAFFSRSEEHTSELQSRLHLVCRLLLEKKKKN